MKLAMSFTSGSLCTRGSVIKSVEKLLINLALPVLLLTVLLLLLVALVFLLALLLALSLSLLLPTSAGISRVGTSGTTST